MSSSRRWRYSVPSPPFPVTANVSAAPASIWVGRSSWASVFSVVFAMTRGPDHGWWTNRGPGIALGYVTLWSRSRSVSPAVATTGIAVAVLVMFVAFELLRARRRRDPLVDLGLFASRGFSGGLVTAATVVMGQAGLMFVLAVFLQATHHLQPIEAGRWLLPVGLAVLEGAQVGGIGAGRVGPDLVVRAGIVIQLTGVIIAAGVLRTDIAWQTLAVALVVFGFGAGMASSQLQSVILAGVPHDRAGSASGIATTNNSLGAALGVAIPGSVLRGGSVASADAARWALVTASALLAAGAFASFAIPAPHAAPETTAAPTNGQAPRVAAGAARSGN
jgi:predicted MFS family arabinose efflux permease